MRIAWKVVCMSMLLIVSRASSEEGCFCNVYGNTLDDCSCTANTIETFNDQIHSKLQKVLTDDYFRYFQVDFISPCKWGWDATCTSPNCGVKTCDLETLPESVRSGSGILERRSDEGEAGIVARLMSWTFLTFPVLETLFTEVRSRLMGVPAVQGCPDPYPQYHDVVQFCKLDPLATENCDIVDLVTNPEQFTGYSGQAAHQVWNTIYNELCFHPEEKEKTLYLTPETAKGMCREKRAFYKLVSGLHSSISIHLCTNYLLEDRDKPVWGKNFKEFQKRFSPETTFNEGPERLKNVYFLYLVELRAIAKVNKILKDLELNSEAKQLLESISQSLTDFPHHFQEADLFQDENMNNVELKEMFKTNFMKISELMDCLGCERCKVWGKLQVTGIGTALKILFTPESELKLTKHEIVALVNAFGRHSTSLEELKHFRESKL